MKVYNKKSQHYFNSFIQGGELHLLQSGEAFFEKLISLIQRSHKAIQIQTFILDDQETGMEIAEALILAADRGVEIDIVVDAFGSRNLATGFVQKLISAGIQFRFFSPISIFKNLNIGRRLHHKIAVFDGHSALIGGINLASKYRGSESIEPWLDFAVLIEGSLCKKFQEICSRIEEKAFSLRRTKSSNALKFVQAKGISIRQNDWLRNKRQIFQSYNLAIQGAEESITIFGSYFLPGLKLRRALEQASKRGVKIKIVLAGNSDIPLILNATFYLYRWLHKNNIRIFEWTKSVLHAKMAIVDDQWMTIGSFNLNHLSTYASIELNVDIADSNFVIKSSHTLNKLIQEDCIEIKIDRSHKLSSKIREFIAYYLGRTLIQTITFFPNFKNIYSKLID